MNKEVLEEEEYVGEIARIIQRDFFPDLARLQETATSMGSGRPPTSIRTNTGTATTLQAKDTHDSWSRPSVTSSSADWDQETPERGAINIDYDDEEQEVRKEAGERQHDMKLNQFLNSYTSEDNAAYEELQAKAIADHKRKYFWAYDDEEGRGDPKRHLLQDGTWLTKDQVKTIDQVTAPKGPKDDRPTAPDSWNYHARNPLIYPPDLETNRQISRVDLNASSRLRLENGSSNAKSNQMRRQKKETVFANSRFPTLEASSTSDESGRTSRSAHDFNLVAMTPNIEPGVDSSPMMTWGDIEGTPMILNASDIQASPFQVKEASHREKIASQLEAQSRGKKARKRSTSQRKIASARERSDSIRSRLSSIRSNTPTPFGAGASALRSSYTTPSRPPRHPSTTNRMKK